jgi:hypothetical protein
MLIILPANPFLKDSAMVEAEERLRTALSIPGEKMAHGIAGSTPFIITGTNHDIVKYFHWRLPKEKDVITIDDIRDFIVNSGSSTIFMHTKFTGLPEHLKQFESMLDKKDTK